MLDLNKRIKEVKDFMNAFNMYYNTNEYSNAVLLKMLPFRDTQNLPEELNELSKILKVNCNSYLSAIGYLCYYLNIPFNAYNIINWLNRYDITTERFVLEDSKRNWILGRNKFNFANGAAIYNKLMSIYYIKNKERNELLGYYAEFLVNEWFIQQQHYNVDWVSQTVGDGLGYDIVVKDNNTNRQNYIEVKSTADCGSYRTQLTKNETRVMKQVKNNQYDEDYNIAFVPFVNDNIKLSYDIINLDSNMAPFIESISGIPYQIMNQCDDPVQSFELIKRC